MTIPPGQNRPLHTCTKRNWMALSSLSALCFLEELSPDLHLQREILDMLHRLLATLLRRHEALRREDTVAHHREEEGTVEEDEGQKTIPTFHARQIQDHRPRLGGVGDHLHTRGLHPEHHQEGGVHQVEVRRDEGDEVQAIVLGAAIAAAAAAVEREVGQGADLGTVAGGERARGVLHFHSTFR
ncbi:hypothetical protein H2200_008726 [Cladophialophora chaetospira]|uniref:Uncharacterized protein n=1 Tax=Cladophialophora chaetospira TaxID=386627 RepID=A0AA38X4W9_9EURO|nr:hypothetical protein H2200_008726 [Cladophialophora chaetospira]